MLKQKLKAKKMNKKKNDKSTPPTIIRKLTMFGRQRATIIVLIFMAIGLFTLLKTRAAPNYWIPTADKPLTLGWILDINSSTNMNGLQTTDLKGNPIAEADVYDIDGENATKAMVDTLHAKGKKVICYFDAGVYEAYRSDANKFPKSIIGSKDVGWDNSYWLDIRQIDILKPIMQARIQMCKDKGFDSIEPDEITNWSNNPGFPITYQDQIKYNRELARWAHDAGLSIGLKGDLEQAHDLVNDFDWTLNEECYMYDECTTISNEGPGADGKEHEGLQVFVQKNKAVWIAEYPSEYPKNKKDKNTISQLTSSTYNSICNDSVKNRFNTAFYTLGLSEKGGRTDCPKFSANPNTPSVSNPQVTITSTPTSLTSPANFDLVATSSLPADIDITANNVVIKNCKNATRCTINISNYQAGTYTFMVEATTSAGGVGSAQTSVLVRQGPGTPQPNSKPTIVLELQSTDLSTKEPANISLLAQAKDLDGSIKTVKLMQNDNIISEISQAPYTFNLLKYKAGTYKFSAEATDNSDASTTSNTITVVVEPKITPPTAKVPAAPTNLGALLDYNWWQGECSWVSNCSLTISWGAVSNASTYEIRRNNKVIGTSSSTSFNEKPVAAGYTYKYQVYAKNSAGYSKTGADLSKTISCFWLFCAID